MAYRIEKFKLNRAGVSSALLKGAGTQTVLEQTANRVAKQSGIGTEISTYSGANRLNVRIEPNTWEDYETNLETNCLLKALH